MVKDARQIGQRPLLGAGSQVGAGEGMMPGQHQGTQIGEGTCSLRALAIALILSLTPQNRQSQIKELSDCSLCLCLEHQAAPIYFIKIPSSVEGSQEEPRGCALPHTNSVKSSTEEMRRFRCPVS